MDPITTARLRLRAPMPDDVDFVLDMYSRPEVTRHIGTSDWVETTEEQALVRIQRYRSQAGRVVGVWLIETLQGADAVGFAIMKPIPLSDWVGVGAAVNDTGQADIEIGGHLHPESWGLGYGTEAAQALLDHARRNGLRRLAAVTSAENTPSQAVARRLGMSHQGTSDRYYNTRCELFTLEL